MIPIYPDYYDGDWAWEYYDYVDEDCAPCDLNCVICFPLGES